MPKSRRKFTSAFKTKIVLECLKERQTLQELAQKHQLHPNQISAWKREFLTNAEQAFGQKDQRQVKALLTERDELFRQIGQMKMENEWLKKKLL